MAMIRYTNFEMMRMLAMAVAYLSCATACQTIVSDHQPTKTKIVTDPPGARIEVNGAYIGDAPVRFAFKQDAAGNLLGHTEIRAIPTDSNLKAQVRSLPAFYVPVKTLVAGVPVTVVFDLKTTGGGNNLDSQQHLVSTAPIAFDEVKARAEQGDAVAEFQIAVMYIQGNGVQSDVAKGDKWLRKAAEDGNANAESVLGVMYGYGGIVERNVFEAVKWWRLAAEQGNAKAQTFLGEHYCTGEGVPQDYSEAVRWFRKAAEQGDANAQIDLGNRFLNGQGVAQDNSEAAKWYRLAAEQGDAEAQYQLGLLYGLGSGVPKDTVEAYRWLSLAAAQGVEGAAESRDALVPPLPDTSLGDDSQPGFAVSGEASPRSFLTTDSYGNVWRTTPNHLGPNNEGSYRTTDSSGKELFLTTPNHLGPNNEGSYRATDSNGKELFRITPDNLGPNHEGGYRATDSSGNVIRITPNNLGPNNGQ